MNHIFIRVESIMQTTDLFSLLFAVLKLILEFVRFFLFFRALPAAFVARIIVARRREAPQPPHAYQPPARPLGHTSCPFKACNNNAKIGNSQPNKLPAGQQPRPTMLSCKTKAKAKVGAARRRLSWVTGGYGWLWVRR